MRKALIYSVLLLFVFACSSKNSTKDTEVETITLKQRLEQAKMLTYKDQTYGVKVSYPDFFVVADTIAGTARFCFPSEQEKKIGLTMFVEPNSDGWNIKQAIENLSDSLNVCVKEGNDYFIMQGKFGNELHALYLEKCFLIGGNWLDLTIFYMDTYENDIERLLDMVIAWEPYNH